MKVTSTVTFEAPGRPKCTGVALGAVAAADAGEAPWPGGEMPLRGASLTLVTSSCGAVGDLMIEGGRASDRR
jgi:hypothetical protein